jgi:hypothetical protein
LLLQRAFHAARDRRFDEAGADFRAAVDLARTQDSRMLELRALTSWAMLPSQSQQVVGAADVRGERRRRRTPATASTRRSLSCRNHERPRLKQVNTGIPSNQNGIPEVIGMWFRLRDFVPLTSGAGYGCCHRRRVHFGLALLPILFLVLVGCRASAAKVPVNTTVGELVVTVLVLCDSVSFTYGSPLGWS